tara:strand:+ start:125 stop:718 length:594 start_codon:yes stop_codon:yes gene_type:complete
MMAAAPAQSSAASDASPLAAQRAHEAELVRGSLAGDPQAARELVRLFHAPIFTYVRRMTGQAQDAEDITQETFVKAFRSLDRVDTDRPLINWLFTIARRTALNHLRARKQWVELPPETASVGPGPRHEVEQREKVTGLWDHARRVLSVPEFEALWLRFGQEMSTEAAANVSGRSTASIKTLIFRARQRLLSGKEMYL